DASVEQFVGHLVQRPPPHLALEVEALEIPRVGRVTPAAAQVAARQAQENARHPDVAPLALHRPKDLTHQELTPPPRPLSSTGLLARLGLRPAARLTLPARVVRHRSYKSVRITRPPDGAAALGGEASCVGAVVGAGGAVCRRAARAASAASRSCFSFSAARRSASMRSRSAAIFRASASSRARSAFARSASARASSASRRSSSAR